MALIRENLVKLFHPRPRYVIRKDELVVRVHASLTASNNEGGGKGDCLAVICIGLTTSFKLLGVTLLLQRLSSNLQRPTV